MSIRSSKDLFEDMTERNRDEMKVGPGRIASEMSGNDVVVGEKSRTRTCGHTSELNFAHRPSRE
jgi:hypothetical protein